MSRQLSIDVSYPGSATQVQFKSQLTCNLYIGAGTVCVRLRQGRQLALHTADLRARFKFGAVNVLENEFGSAMV